MQWSMVGLTAVTLVACSSEQAGNQTRSSVATSTGGANAVHDASAHSGGTGSGAAPGTDAADGATIVHPVPPVPYSCIGGEVLRAAPAPHAGSAPDADAAAREAGPPPPPQFVPWTGTLGSCVAGASFCFIRSSQLLNAPPHSSCRPISGALAVCAGSPNCACLCSHGVQCYTECSCADNDAGFATVACSQI
jgi:hypothetical protein